MIKNREIMRPHSWKSFSFKPNIFDGIEWTTKTQTAEKKCGTGTNVVRWRSKLVPGLERVLTRCDCGCDMTYDELGNASKALKENPDLGSELFFCPTGCCDTANFQQTKEPEKATSTDNDSMETVSGLSETQEPESDEADYQRQKRILDRIFNKSAYCSENMSNNNNSDLAATSSSEESTKADDKSLPEQLPKPWKELADDDFVFTQSTEQPEQKPNSQEPYADEAFEYPKETDQPDQKRNSDGACALLDILCKKFRYCRNM